MLSLIGSLVFVGHADVISVNFNNGVAFVDTTEFTGVESDTSWVEQTVGTATFSTAFYENLDGTTLDVNVLSTASGRTASSVWDGWAQEVGFKIRSGNLFQCQFEQIPYDEYKIIVYIGDATDQEARLRLGNDAADPYTYISASALTTKPSLVESTDIDNSDGYDPGSYVIFGTDENPLTGTEQLLQIGGMLGNGTIFGGFQLVAIPEPVSVGLLGSGTCLLLLMRRIRMKI
jgi:hypothetical protein